MTAVILFLVIAMSQSLFFSFFSYFLIYWLNEWGKAFGVKSNFRHRFRSYMPSACSQVRRTACESKKGWFLLMTHRCIWNGALSRTSAFNCCHVWRCCSPLCCLRYMWASPINDWQQKVQGFTGTFPFTHLLQNHLLMRQMEDIWCLCVASPLACNNPSSPLLFGFWQL